MAARKNIFDFVKNVATYEETEENEQE